MCVKLSAEMEFSVMPCDANGRLSLGSQPQVKVRCGWSARAERGNGRRLSSVGVGCRHRQMAEGEADSPGFTPKVVMDQNTNK